MPLRRPSRQATKADKAAGQAAEGAFAAWLDGSRVPYLYAEQSRETFAEGLRGTAKRPDFLVMLPYLRPLAVDVEIKTAYDGHLIFDVAEVRKLAAFSELFNTVGLFACIAPNGSPLMKWVPLANFLELTPEKINCAQAYVVKLTDALTIDKRKPFKAALIALLDDLHEATEQLPSSTRRRR